MNPTVALNRTYTFENGKTYLFAALFVAGNVVLPQLCHLIPNGGLIFLPIYFFTLIGTLTYGWRVGLLTALLSPLVNNVLFGMPPIAVMPVIEVKSVILAIAAASVAAKASKLNLAAVAIAVIVAQVAGGMFEWAWTGSLNAAVQDFKIGLPGLLIQIFGAFIIVKLLVAKK